MEMLRCYVIHDIIVDFFIFIYLKMFRPKNGEYKDWHKNGKLRVHCYFKDGEYDGEYKDWHKNGQLWEHCYYKDGMMDREYRRYYYTGQLSVYYYFKDGKKDGEFKNWYDDGELRYHCYYKDGKKCTYKEYHSLGIGCYIRRNMNGDVKVICDS